MRLQWGWYYIQEYYLAVLLIWLLVYIVFCLLQKNRKFPFNGSFRFMNVFLICSALIYTVLFLYVTLFSRAAGAEFQYELSFLWEYRMAFGMEQGKIYVQNMAWVWQILDNILLFVPFGVLFGEFLFRKKKKSGWRMALVTGGVASLTVEVLQLVMRLGLFEFDDLFHNTIGMMVGYGGCVLVHFLMEC